MKSSRIYPLLLPPVVAQLIVEAASSGGPLRCQPAHASLHEAQRLLPCAHLLHQGPDVKLENSLRETGRNGMISFSSPSTDIPLDFLNIARCLHQSDTSEMTCNFKHVASLHAHSTIRCPDSIWISGRYQPKIPNIRLYRTLSIISNINALIQSVHSAPAFLPDTNT